MLGHYFLAAAALAVVFVMFLVIARTLNSIINLLVKLEYLLQKECDRKKEMREVQLLMEQDAAERQSWRADDDAAPPRNEKGRPAGR